MENLKLEKEISNAIDRLIEDGGRLVTNIWNDEINNNAYCYCALGALFYVNNIDVPHALTEIISFLKKETGKSEDWIYSFTSGFDNKIDEFEGNFQQDAYDMGISIREKYSKFIQ